ncbi:cupin domain-containing protein [Actinomadura nitritigenes]|uniref:Cupin domain-containing protein n=1 Tax=Actinomadura nitritigenes TaxID=134602 RepID=A0ABS3QUD5_9ACTN|nr:cupin domain-containing protein [Actinomadura nitritigenes]MBO2437593.1 cupin domain-containing protein [Actinomadura nitritigenes]
MSGLTKVSMEDVSPSRRLGGGIRPLLSPTSVGATAGFLGTMSLDRGDFVAAHYHPFSEEFIFVAEGSVLLRIDEDELLLGTHEAAMVPKTRSHRIENASASPALLVFQMAPLAPTPEQGHVEVEPVPYPDAPPPSLRTR